jgi:hypothetical protein
VLSVQRAHYGAMARPPSIDTLVPTSASGRALLRVCVFAIAVAQERRNIAKGSRQGVRRVDARTGAAPSVRQTIVVLGLRDVIRWLVRAIPGPGATPRQSDPELQREFERARAEHADDPDALQDAIMRIYRERRVTTTITCLPILIRTVVAIAANRAPIPFLAEQRTIADVLAGTKLVRSGPSRWARLRRWHRAPATKARPLHNHTAGDPSAIPFQFDKPTKHCLFGDIREPSRRLDS